MPRNSAPVPVLADRIDAFWEHSGGAREHRILPDGCMDFVFDLEHGGAWLVGAMSAAEIVQARPGTLFGVRFLPGAAAAYVSEAANAFVDERIDLADVTARAASNLAERVATAPHRRAREGVIIQFLLDAASRLRAPDVRVRRAASLIARARGDIAMREVAAAANVGERQLERLFHSHVGIAPKHYARIARLEHACRLLAESPRPQAELAAHAGYADESHLLRDFRDLAGATPAAIRAERHVGFVQAATVALP
ncbi:MAG TPA: helix-turn-helix transcriptional regulator [Polyangiaceae bacterium]